MGAREDNQVSDDFLVRCSKQTYRATVMLAIFFHRTKVDREPDFSVGVDDFLSSK